MSNVYERSFVFSQKQMQDKIRIETSNGGAKPKFGTVVVRGVAKTYTDIVTPGTALRYGDSRILITGDIRNIKYSEPSE